MKSHAQLRLLERFEGASFKQICKAVAEYCKTGFHCEIDVVIKDNTNNALILRYTGQDHVIYPVIDAVSGRIKTVMPHHYVTRMKRRDKNIRRARSHKNSDNRK